MCGSGYLAFCRKRRGLIHTPWYPNPHMAEGKFKNNLSHSLYLFFKPNFILRELICFGISYICYIFYTNPSGNSPSKYHLFFSHKPSKSGNIAVPSSISSIWEDYQIEKLKNNQWKRLWCDFKFQGINATKAIASVIKTKCMHINGYTASIDQAYLLRYNKL